LKPEDLQPPLRLDAEVKLAEINLDSLAELDRLKPMGQGNPPVQFFARDLTQARPAQRMGADKKHVKMWVKNGAVTHEVVWWNAADQALPDGTFDLAFAPAVNDFNGRRTVQLKFLDWRPA
jgi:single-stranded-DNA-specific exonuclease